MEGESRVLSFEFGWFTFCMGDCRLALVCSLLCMCLVGRFGTGVAVIGVCILFRPTAKTCEGLYEAMSAGATLALP